MLATAMNTDQERLVRRRQVWLDYGASDLEVQELLAYNQNIFVHDQDRPTQPEAHVAVWREYLADAAQMGVWESLRRRLVQLRWPIEAGISETVAYQNSTRRGWPVPAEVEGVQLRSPELLELFIHETWAGPIPVIFAGDRADFEQLVQADRKSVV